MSLYVTKASGEKERFSVRKLNRSLRKAGVKLALRTDIINHIIQTRPSTTQQIHEYVNQVLAQEKVVGSMARYNVKQALMRFGPAGFPFEKFVAELLRAQGYEAVTDTMIQGKCISHEIDISAQKEDLHLIIECKFHQRPGLKSDVKVVLATKARFDDIVHAWVPSSKGTGSFHSTHQAWAVTNTKFTTAAIQYGQCVGVHMLGWSYPSDQSLGTLIDQYKLHPITALPSLSFAHQQLLLHHGIVLCTQIIDNQNKLRSLGLSTSIIEQLLQDAREVITVT
jgi:Holliday junction resolvase-like predicted endonuclease